MRTHLAAAPLLLACVLAACSSDPDTTDGSSSTADTTTGTTTGATQTPTTGSGTDDTTATDDATGDTTGDATGAVSAGDTSTGTGGAGDTSTGTGGASDTSTGGASDTSTGGDTSTGDPDGLGQAALDIVAALEAAVDGVYYFSESEDTWTVFAIADAAPVTEANVKDVLAEVYVPHDDLPLADRAVELRTLAQLMDPLTVMQDWWGPENVMQAEDYKPIRAIFEDQLSDVQVFRLGEQSGNILVGQIDVFVIGETADGDLVGMFAVAVET